MEPINISAGQQQLTPLDLLRAREKWQAYRGKPYVRIVLEVRTGYRDNLFLIDYGVLPSNHNFKKIRGYKRRWRRAFEPIVQCLDLYEW